MYKLIKESPNLTSHTKLTENYSDAYNPNSGDMGTFFGKRITSGVGKRNVAGGSPYHYGLDLAYNNEPVNAFCSGTVIFAGNMIGFGRVVFIKDVNGYCHCYAHLSQINVKVNQQLNKGDLIGKSGTSYFDGKVLKDNHFAPHLHYSIWRKFAGRESENAIDPRIYQYP